MIGKRVTIYDIALALGISPSSVSKALNNYHGASDKLKKMVSDKAVELGYKHNSTAANLRRGSSKTIGVIVPNINHHFFSEVIAGLEEICFEQNHSLIICQSQESIQKENKSIETLIHQNVDCIMISISAETTSTAYLEQIINNHIHLIQFDRCLDEIDSWKILNDNEESSYRAVNKLISEGYRKIAFLGGPEHLSIFNNRKAGYLRAIKESALSIPYNFIVNCGFSLEEARREAELMLTRDEKPDAFFTVSDHQSLGVIRAAENLGLLVPEELGVFGFANEAFTELVKPTLSSVDQRSRDIGRSAANVYFNHLINNQSDAGLEKMIVIKSDIISRESSSKSRRV
jgi:DNA-binding LacI/PurR family transcriptional regulator